MLRRIFTISLALFWLMGTAAVLAQEMPPMGPPEEIKKLNHMIGTWKGDFQYKADPMGEEWSTTTATMKVDWILDGCAQRTHFSANMMGMDFRGQATASYDRESKKWQSSWIDNFSAKQVVTTGHFTDDGKLVFEGDDTMMGQPFRMRDTTIRVSDTELKWTWEMSFDGGNTWITQMKGIYKKQPE